MIRDKVVPVIIFVLLAFMVFNALHTRYVHKEFFSDVRAFMSQGGRNTASHGFDLCERVAELERLNNIKPSTSCNRIYFGTGNETKSN